MGTKINNDLYDISVQDEEELPEEIEEESEDEAAAVGDPHMHTTSDDDFDLTEADLQRHGHDGGSDDWHGDD